MFSLSSVGNRTVESGLYCWSASCVVGLIIDVVIIRILKLNMLDICFDYDINYKSII